MGIRKASSVKAGLIRVLAAGTLALAASGVGATQAQALPTDCYSVVLTGRTMAYAWCNAGTGQLKEAISCRNFLGFYAYREGPWVNRGTNPSWATCPFGYTITSAWYLRR